LGVGILQVQERQRVVVLQQELGKEIRDVLGSEQQVLASKQPDIAQLQVLHISNCHRI
jgi:hypothetical protein